MKPNAETDADRPGATRIALFAIVLATCAATSGCTDDDWATANARLAVQAQLRNPDSAKFGDMHVVWQPRSNDTPHVMGGASCGTVNAENGFGGMTGPLRFVVVHALNDELGTKDNVLAVIEDPTKRQATVGSSGTEQPATVFEEVYWNHYCVDAGHPPQFTGQTNN